MLQALVAVMVMAAAAASALPTRAPLVSYHIAGVPLAESRRDECGPSALAAVLQYHGERVSAADIGREIDLPGYHGALNLDLLLWARTRGYPAWAGEGSVGSLQQALARGLPVICMVRRRGRAVDRNHFVVVRGYDNERQEWFVDEGKGGEETVGAGDFARDWAECGRWMLVVEGRREGADAVREQAPG
jgi:ABC-type bacteriocin/lantibiotic exporter with double-glycine peptidase domain